MKIFEIIAPVVRAFGVQVYHVEAESLEGAKSKWLTRDAEFVSEQLGCVELGEPKIREIVTEPLH